MFSITHPIFMGAFQSKLVPNKNSTSISKNKSATLADSFEQQTMPSAVSFRNGGATPDSLITRLQADKKSLLKDCFLGGLIINRLVSTYSFTLRDANAWVSNLTFNNDETIISRGKGLLAQLLKADVETLQRTVQYFELTIPELINKMGITSLDVVAVQQKEKTANDIVWEKFQSRLNNPTNSPTDEDFQHLSQFVPFIEAQLPIKP